MAGKGSPQGSVPTFNNPTLYFDPYNGTLWQNLTGVDTGWSELSFGDLPNYTDNSSGGISITEAGSGKITITGPALNFTIGATGSVSSGIFIATASVPISVGSTSGNVSVYSGSGYLHLSGNSVELYGDSGGIAIGFDASDDIGFFGATPIAQPTVTGSRGGNAALASLLTALADLGLIVDSST
jgi:hypothetical protein